MTTMTTRTTLRSVFYAAIVSLPQRALPALPVLLPLLLAACSEAADGGSYATADDPLALRSLTVGVADAAETRGASDLTDGTDYMAPTTRTTGDQDTHGNYCCFEDGERFFAVASQGASLQTAVYQCGARQSNTSGEKTYYYNTATAEGQPLMASATGDTKIRAFAPYQAGGTTDGATVSVNHLSTSFSVQQTQTSGADLRASDLLYAEATMAAGATAAVNPGGTWHQADKLSFQHQLSQLVIRFANSDANSQYPTLQRVRVTSGYRTIALQSASDGTMTLSTAAGALSDALSAASPMTVFDGSQTIDNTEPGVEIGFHPSLGDRYHVCILPPQTLAAGTTLIQAETSVGTISYYLPQAQTLLAGRSYRITLPVAPVAQTGAVAITDWDETTWTYTAQGTATTDTQYHADGALLFNVGGVEFNMIRVLPGTATSGGSTYTVTEDYYIGETEVTQALWKAVMGGLVRTAGGTATVMTATGDDYPICGISYSEVTTEGANYFFTRLNELAAAQLPEGYEFSIPTELQWRYAASGGRYSHGYTYAGSSTTNATDVAWTSANSGLKAHPVARLKPNELGLYDMTGNAWEYGWGTGNSTCFGGSLNDPAYDNTFSGNMASATTANQFRGVRLALVPRTVSFAYTGSVQTFTAPTAGCYKIECWGAQGGSKSPGVGGKGGYSVGYYRLAAGGKLYVYVGQQGTTYSSKGWNGGGAGSSNDGMSGGGATDVRTVQCATATNWKDKADGSETTDASLLSRIIVAGGGGGATWTADGSLIAGYRNRDGGYGGGERGGDGVKWLSNSSSNYMNNYNTYTTVARGATQTAVGAGFSHSSGAYQRGGDGQYGTFGRGGNGCTNKWKNTSDDFGNWGAGGGGGWYGGGGGGGVDCVVGSGGGGSGYVGGVADGRMIAGNAVMPSTTYGTELGHTGNGYCRITWQSK